MQPTPLTARVLVAAALLVPASQGAASEADSADVTEGSGSSGDAAIVRHLLRDGEYDPDQLTPQPGASVGDITRCPVSGNVFVVTEAHPVIETEGGPIFVCCSRCVAAYQRNPELFR